MSTKRYNRKATSITISIFYENYQMGKYNMDPPYQRDYNVWDKHQKSFLLDSILKNFPIPPIFLEQKIDGATGKTMYDVIDGKQRLSTIAAFIEGQISLPSTFGKDEYGYAALNGKTFEDLKHMAQKDPQAADFLSNFWSYTISIEYIERPDEKIVDNIFDRLNREGTRLNAAELRKAKYYDTNLYCVIATLREDHIFRQILMKLNKNRLQDISFITEVVLFVQQDAIIDGDEDVIDEIFENSTDTISDERKKELLNEVRTLETIVQSFELDLDAYSIRGVSHLYALFYLAFIIYKNEIEVSDALKQKLMAFYDDLRNHKVDDHVKNYHSSMQSASKNRHSRQKRIDALLQYVGLA